MLNKFINYTKKHKLITVRQKVLLAVSGGIDSVVMLDLFHKAGFKFDIAHCNFKLRLFESDDDELFVRALAHKYNVDIFVNWCNTKNYAENHKLSIQEAARELRYSWFNHVCNINNYSLVAVAHHQDDLIETFFINLFRGAGIKGLKSIPVTRQNIIRPIMFATRSDIEQYAIDNKLKYREDSSNSTDHYLRNRIRHHLLPKIEELSPGASDSIKKSIDNLHDSDLLLQSCIENRKIELFRETGNNNFKISIEELMKLSPLKTWMYYLLSEYNYSRNVTDSICNTLLSDSMPGALFLSSTHELLIDRENIILRQIPEEITNTTAEIKQNTPYITSPLPVNFNIIPASGDFSFSESKKIAYFDLNKLEFPLTIRKWETGDKMKPFGMSGNKLVSDILIDNKVDYFEKDNVYVMLSGHKIIWLIGYRSSEYAKVTKNTDKIMIMEVLSNTSGYELTLFNSE